LGIGDWGLGPIPNPQSPIPNPQSPFYLIFKYILIRIINEIKILYPFIKLKIKIFFIIIKMDSSIKLSEEKIELNKMKSKDIFQTLKCDYFLQKLFNILMRKKSLDIIKYNKNIKNRMNINIKDYKEYSEIYSSIEIEIKPVNNKYGKFININEENKKYYHIYFDNNKEEIKRNYLNENEQIKLIKIIIDYQVKSFKELFYECKSIESIKFKKFYRNNITNMDCIFNQCLSLKELDLSNFNTNNVTNMQGMFYECSSLKELNLSNFNTNNVTNMSNMFDGCKSLKELNLSNFNTDNVTNMIGMFYDCSSLEELNISNFNTNNVKYMLSMFSKCSSLKELNLSNFITDNVIDMRYMFYDCYSLKELNLSHFNTNNVIDMVNMFLGCSDELLMKIKSQYKNIKEEAFK